MYRNTNRIFTEKDMVVAIQGKIGILHSIKMTTKNLHELKMMTNNLRESRFFQIWKVGLNFNWKGIYSLNPSEMKGNINNCPLIDKYKLAKPFHKKKLQKTNIVFQQLLWKHTCMWWRGISQLNPCNSLVCPSLNTPFKLNQNTKRSLLMTRFEKVIGVCN